MTIDTVIEVEQIVSLVQLRHQIDVLVSFILKVQVENAAIAIASVVQVPLDLDLFKLKLHIVFLDDSLFRVDLCSKHEPVFVSLAFVHLAVLALANNLKQTELIPEPVIDTKVHQI